MPRDVIVSPWVSLEGAQWRYTLTVTDDTGSTTFEHLEPAGVTATAELTLLDLYLYLTVGDADTDQDVDDAFYLDDIKAGAGVETVWGNWKLIAEGIIAGLTPGYDNRDFHNAWGPSDTNALRQDAATAIGGRGWTATGLHWHEGDRTIGNA